MAAFTMKEKFGRFVLCDEYGDEVLSMRARESDFREMLEASLRMYETVFGCRAACAYNPDADHWYFFKEA
jgi:hypothetical protein